MHVTLDDAKRGLRFAATVPLEQRCRMNYEDKIGRHCAVGHALKHIGIPPPGLGSGCNSTSINKENIEKFFRDRGYTFDAAALDLFARAQELVDCVINLEDW